MPANGPLRQKRPAFRCLRAGASVVTCVLSARPNSLARLFSSRPASPPIDWSVRVFVIPPGSVFLVTPFLSVTITGSVARGLVAVPLLDQRRQVEQLAVELLADVGAELHGIDVEVVVLLHRVEAAEDVLATGRSRPGR